MVTSLLQTGLDRIKWVKGKVDGETRNSTRLLREFD